MMLPNLISVSVMPGCCAKAADEAASDTISARKAAGADWLDRIMLYPPRRVADYVLFVLGKGYDMAAEPVLR
jgi:hypothetical protein